VTVEAAARTLALIRGIYESATTRRPFELEEVVGRSSPFSLSACRTGRRRKRCASWPSRAGTASSGVWPGPEGYRAAFEQRRKEFQAVAELSRTYGVRALIELHHRSLIAGASATARFVEGFDPQTVGVIHDIGNMLREGYEHDPWSLEILGEHLAHVHVKNAVPRPERVEGENRTRWTWEWAPMREGVGDYDQLFSSLARMGYDGGLSVEDFSTELPLPERVRDNLAYLREVTTRVGID
jgi:sugar phosphate isomerase/epimerase